LNLERRRGRRWLQDRGCRPPADGAGRFHHHLQVRFFRQRPPHHKTKTKHLNHSLFFSVLFQLG
jgi:hypothetical protein